MTHRSNRLSALLVAGFILGGSIACGQLKSDEARTAVASKSKAVLQALEHRQFSVLAKFVSPGKGVRFSPYASVDTDSDLVLTKSDLSSPAKLAAVRRWGSFDGSGLPIRLTFSAYFSKFVWDRDFARKAQVNFGKPQSRGNTSNNVSEVYPNAMVVEYYVAPTGDAKTLAEWSSLELVFEEEDGNWYLVGIVHDQWTI